MAEIQLTNGLIALVDEADLPALIGFRWYHQVPQSSIGAGYAISGSANTRHKIYMHRFLLGAPAGVEVDHKNRNSLDNRRENLRFATRSQQCANIASASQIVAYRGVRFFPKRAKPYRAALTYLGIRRVGKYRLTAEEAASDYDHLALTHFGEFAILNFPEAAL